MVYSFHPELHRGGRGEYGFTVAQKKCAPGVCCEKLRQVHACPWLAARSGLPLILQASRPLQETARPVAHQSKQPLTVLAVKTWAFLLLFEQMVQRVDIGTGAGHENIGVGTAAHSADIALAQAHGHFALGVRAAGDGVDSVLLKFGLAALSTSFLFLL